MRPAPTIATSITRATLLDRPIPDNGLDRAPTRVLEARLVRPLLTPTEGGDMGGDTLTRRAALGRFALAGAGMAAGPAALAGRAWASPSAQPTKFKDFKPFNLHVKPGPATGLPKRVATNFPAGSQY